MSFNSKLGKTVYIRKHKGLAIGDVGDAARLGMSYLSENWARTKSICRKIGAVHTTSNIL